MPHRSQAHRLVVILALALAPGAAHAGEAPERWGICEIALPGPSGGNPFIDVEFSARFRQGDAAVAVPGFYDGEGTYRARFSPDRAGTWTYETASNRLELAGKSGRFEVAEAAPGNHGPVRVANAFHFEYADGTSYYPVGTTCYAWTHQSDKLEAATLATLKAGPFNKIRMCVFPKFYAYNKDEPPRYPFAGTPPASWDFARFDPAFFRHLEERVGQLRDLGIVADLILFHPYDEGHWGFDRMPPEADDRYVRYVVARLGAYRNVWWSLANEYDFLKEKREADWDRLFKVVQASDPHDRPRSIHNGTQIYDHNRPWVTHASIQNGSAVEDFGRAGLYRDVYRKPIVLDEVKYEGDLPQRWGNLSGPEMVHRFWQGAIAGTYAGHGETYLSPDDVIWWSRGGTLRGESPARIAFLRQILEAGPAGGLEPVDKWQEPRVAGRKGEYYLVYLGKETPTEWPVRLPSAKVEGPLTLRAEVIDTWGMTVTPVDRTFTLRAVDRYTLADEGASIPLPGRPYMAIRLRKQP